MSKKNILNRGDKIKGISTGNVYEINMIDRNGNITTTDGSVIYRDRLHKFEKVKTIKTYWVARDKNGSLFVYNHEPVRLALMFRISRGSMKRIDDRYAKIFKEITWENSPYSLDLEV